MLANYKLSGSSLGAHHNCRYLETLNSFSPVHVRQDPDVNSKKKPHSEEGKKGGGGEGGGGGGGGGGSYRIRR